MSTPESVVADEVDFETALADPAAFYTHPADIVADDQLTVAQKRRFLTEWAQDLTDRQQASGEGMDSGSAAATAAEGDLLRKINAALEQLGNKEEADKTRAGRSFWKRLLPLRSA